MSKTRKVPEIRFKGYADSWKQRKLDCTNTVFTDGNYGESYPKSSDMTDSITGVPFLTGGNLRDGKLSIDGASYITLDKHLELTSGHLEEDDIVIAVRGSLGALGYVNYNNAGWNINSQLAILRTNKNELYGAFLIQYLLSQDGQNELLKRQTGSALKQLPIKSLKDLKVPISSIDEQKEIANFLSQLDNRITLHQRKYDALKTMKKILLSKMFPKYGDDVPEIRFKGFADAWEQRKLSEVVEYRNGKGKEDKQSSTGKYELINLNSIHIDGGLKTSGKFVDDPDDLLQKNDLVMILSDVGKGNLLGRVAIIPESNKYVLNQRVALLRPVNIDMTSFLFVYINAHQYYFKAKGAGMSQLNISKDAVQNFCDFMPETKEQQCIGNLFSNVDRLITLHQRKLQKFKNIKKAMLEKMFV